MAQFSKSPKIFKLPKFCSNELCSYLEECFTRNGDRLLMGAYNQREKPFVSYHLDPKTDFLQDYHKKLLKIGAFYFNNRSIRVFRNYVLFSESCRDSKIHRDFDGRWKVLTSVLVTSLEEEYSKIRFFSDGMEEEKEYELEVGDLIIFDSRTLHRQGAGLARRTLISNMCQLKVPASNRL